MGQIHLTKRVPRPPATFAGVVMVGVCAFSGSFLGSSWIPSKRRCLVPPTYTEEDNQSNI
jgi:hypothetical protein